MYRCDTTDQSVELLRHRLSAWCAAHVSQCVQQNPALPRFETACCSTHFIAPKHPKSWFRIVRSQPRIEVLKLNALFHQKRVCVAVTTAGGSRFRLGPAAGAAGGKAAGGWQSSRPTGEDAAHSDWQIRAAAPVLRVDASW